MDTDNLLIICRSCGRKTLMHNMRPYNDGENMICVECLKKKGPSVTPVSNIFAKKTISNSPSDAPLSKKNKTEHKEKMIKYICTNCKYKFSRKESQSVEKCPYCGRDSIMIDNALGADKLIKESADKRFEGW